MVRPPSPSPRGALSNPTSRFERVSLHPCDDAAGEGGAGPATTLTAHPVRTVIARNDSPDVPFDRSLNPYRGCEHGCIYCFARPSHAFLDLSPGLDFETRLYYKPEAPERLRAELAHPAYRCAVLALGSNTDPYQPVERRTRLTRELLEVLSEHEHPVAVVTKSDLVLRDADLLASLASRGLAAVMISVTTLDPDLARRMEPRAPTPTRRLEAIAGLARAGVPVGVLASPIVPALNEAELERILEAAAGAGAGWAGWVLLRLPGEVGPLFGEWLEREYPDRAARVLGQMREMRGGRLYQARFGARMRGEGTLAGLLKRRFEVACRRHGLERRSPTLDTSRFRSPSAGTQLALFR